MHVVTDLNPLLGIDEYKIINYDIIAEFDMFAPDNFCPRVDGDVFFIDWPLSLPE